MVWKQYVSWISLTQFIKSGINPKISAGFTCRLDRLKPRVSTIWGASVKVYNSFNTVIERSHVCCHSVLYFLNNPSGIFLTQLHSISEYCRILNTPHHLRLCWNWLSTLPSSSKSWREGPHKWNSLGPLFI
jgi:hypothetical protein